jgi:Protein of unknown function (DUF3515)
VAALRLPSAVVRAGGAVTCAVLLAGCGASGAAVQVDTPTLAGTAAAQCARVIKALPSTLDDQDRRDVAPAGAAGMSAAWGDPAIVLRCGVPRPAALRRTSFCFVVNRVGWLATQDGEALPMTRPVPGTVDFTTIGRSVYVELSVPGTYQPQGDVLPEVARAISSSTRDVHPCV